MAQDYKNNNLTYAYAYAAEYDFESYAQTKSLISNIWSQSYNLIANCNHLLNNLAKADTAMFQLQRVERDLIMGETLALRALFHFDLLRLFGPVPMRDDGKVAIPYVKDYPNYYTPPKPMDEVLSDIVADLEQAASLVAHNDTITHRTQTSYGVSALFAGSYTPKHVFFNYRGHRLNYMAIHALLARVHMYAGNTAKAMEEAKYLYDKYGPHGKGKYWTFTTEGNAKGQNKYIKFADDIMFAFYDNDLMTKVQSFFAQNRWPLSDDFDTWLDKTKRDFRVNLVNESKQSEKWIETLSTAQNRKLQNTIIPVIRFSEVYYIYSECLYRQGNHTEALKVLNQVRLGRGRTDTFSGTDENEFYEELLQEYRREFFTDGQTFFTHKRLNRDIVTSIKTHKMDESIIPAIPENETIF